VTINRLPKGALITDVVFALLVLILGLMGFSLGLMPWAWAAIIPLVSAVVLRRMSPGLALTLAWVGAAIQLTPSQSPYPVDIAVLMVLYSVAAYGSQRARIAGMISIPVGAMLAGFHQGMMFNAVPGMPATGLWALLSVNSVDDINWPAVLLFAFITALVLSGSWLAGLLRRAVLQSREADVARRLAEQAMTAEQERGRIARDMHDVVAHSLAVVIAQADGARYLAASDHEAPQQALATIAATARSALTDVRGLLAELRHRADPGPQPGFGDLDGLFAQFRAAGLSLQIAEQGERPLDWPGGRQLAVYRIVQESLTNALRHGDTGSLIQAQLRWSEPFLHITVRNRLRRGGGQVDPNARPGHGVIGMLERAALVGGSVQSGVDGEQFVVQATIPFPESGE
jgi:signal transduction histidine kinase